MTPNIGEEAVSPKPKKEDHVVRVSSYFVGVARRLAAQQDIAFAEVLGKAVEVGLKQAAEEANKINIWERTSAKAEVIHAIDKIPLSRMEEALQRLKELEK